MSDPRAQPSFWAAPFASGEVEVLPAWIDANNHMNLAYYTVAFDLATDVIFDVFDCSYAYKDRVGCGTFAAESHNMYEAELLLGERARIVTHVVGVDAKRVHLAHEMYRADDGRRAATQELMYLHVDLGIRRVVPWPDDVRARIQAACESHATIARPDWTGRRIAMPAPTRQSIPSPRK
ncbi:MAG: thioesterase family protein [Acetobacteraceae bacterium]|nr:thioesterase family protein [Acetobacteraceae bacterium]